MNTHTKILFVFLLLSVVCLPLYSVLAQQYHFVEPIPGIGGVVEANDSTYARYLRAVFNFSIGAAALLAVLMIVIGGVQYTTSYSSSGKGEARARILNAVLGLLLVLGAWLLLYTINPDLVNLRLVIPPLSDTSGGGGGSGGGGTPPPEPPDEEEYTYHPNEQAVRDALEALPGDVTVNNTQPCPEGMRYQDYRARHGTGCTSVGGLSSETITKLGELSTGCGCSIVITGGTEAGHQTHGPGNIVDLRAGEQNLNTFIVGGEAGIPLRQVRLNSRGERVYTVPGLGSFTRESDHWHVVF